MRATTGVRWLPASWCFRLGWYSAKRQRECPHPWSRRRFIHGDERIYGYRTQCMDCGLLSDKVSPK